MPVFRVLRAVSLLVAIFILPLPATARRIRIDCVDGIPNPLVEAYREHPYCDADRSCDGVCTFAFCTLEDFLCSVHPPCVSPSAGICEPGENPAATIVVPAGRRRLLRAGTVHSVGRRVILYCRSRPPSVPCP